jgi:hypothetical protein
MAPRKNRCTARRVNGARACAGILWNSMGELKSYARIEVEGRASPEVAGPPPSRGGNGLMLSVDLRFIGVSVTQSRLA